MVTGDAFGMSGGWLENRARVKQVTVSTSCPTIPLLINSFP